MSSEIDSAHKELVDLAQARSLQIESFVILQDSMEVHYFELKDRLK